MRISSLCERGARSSHTSKWSFFQRNFTSSCRQPLDAGIIKNFKVQYQKHIVTITLAQIDGSSLTASEITKSAHILTAIWWVKQSEVGRLITTIGYLATIYATRASKGAHMLLGYTFTMSGGGVLWQQVKAVVHLNNLEYQFVSELTTHQ